MITTEWDVVAAALVSGSVAVIPTDTVYGIAARLGDRAAIDTVFAAKHRPPTVALPVLIGDLSQARELVGDLTPAVEGLLRQWWPGAVTVVLEAPDDVARAVGSTSSSVGLRIPDDDRVRALCLEVGPLVATSANRHGEKPCRSADEAVACFRGVDDLIIFDGGTVDGTSSTVVDLTSRPAMVLREGTALDAVLRALSSFNEG